MSADGKRELAKLLADGIHPGQGVADRDTLTNSIPAKGRRFRLGGRVVERTPDGLATAESIR